MKIGERGQITIPKRFRQKFGLKPNSDVEFVEEGGRLVLRKVAMGIDPVEQLAGSCQTSLKSLGFKSVDEYLEQIRGR
jgi:antitoxin PrlF